MNAKLDALLDTLDNMKHPKEMVAVIHCNPYKINPHSIPGAYSELPAGSSLSDWESTAPGKVGTVIDYWWSNDGVTLMTNAPVRSTSMGDQMLLQNGKKYTCEATGWTENAD